MNVVDLSKTSLRDLNSRFHNLPKDTTHLDLDAGTEKTRRLGTGFFIA